MEKLIEEHMYLAKYIASKYKNKGIPYEDLVQEGYIGLIRAASHFDASRGVKFSTYATFWCKQAILEAITSKSRVIRLPAHVVQLKLRIYKFIEGFLMATGYEPDNKVIAKELKTTVSQVEAILNLTTEHVGDWEVEAEDQTVLDNLEVEEEYEQVIKEIRKLSDKEQLVLGMKFGILKLL